MEKILYAIEKVCGQIYIYTYAYEKMFTETSYPYCFFLDGYESIISIIILITFGK